MKLNHIAAHIGPWPDTIAHPRGYFLTRGCIIDCRGTIVIAEDTRWGLGVKVVTESHDTHSWPELGPIVDRPVIVDQFAWIGSYSVLIGCHIGEAAIVAAGTVVRSQNVAPYTMVAGNPARVIARWYRWALVGWIYEPAEQSGFKRELI